MFNKNKKIIKIEGMHCENCAHHVETALKDIDGVEKVKVSLNKKEAVVTTSKNIDENLIKDKIKDAGYTVSSIK